MFSFLMMLFWVVIVAIWLRIIYRTWIAPEQRRYEIPVYHHVTFPVAEARFRASCTITEEVSVACPRALWVLWSGYEELCGNPACRICYYKRTVRRPMIAVALAAEESPYNVCPRDCSVCRRSRCARYSSSARW